MIILAILIRSLRLELEEIEDYFFQFQQRRQQRRCDREHRQHFAKGKLSMIESISNKLLHYGEIYSNNIYFNSVVVIVTISNKWQHYVKNELVLILNISNKWQHCLVKNELVLKGLIIKKIIKVSMYYNLQENINVNNKITGSSFNIIILFISTIASDIILRQSILIR